MIEHFSRPLTGYLGMWANICAPTPRYCKGYYSVWAFRTLFFLEQKKAFLLKRNSYLLFYSLFIILFNKKLKKKGIGTNLINGCLPSISSSIFAKSL